MIFMVIVILIISIYVWSLRDDLNNAKMNAISAKDRISTIQTSNESDELSKFQASEYLQNIIGRLK